MSRQGAPLGACILTASLSTIAGGAFGVLGLVPYAFGGHGPDSPVSGVLFGALAGLLVARGWVAWMRLHAFEDRGDGVVGAAVRGGILAGAAASVLLHLCLQLLYRSDAWLFGQVAGLVCGVIAGSGVGAVGGLAWRSALPRERG